MALISFRILYPNETSTKIKKKCREGSDWIFNFSDCKMLHMLHLCLIWPIYYMLQKHCGFLSVWMPASVEMRIHHIMYVQRATQHVYSYKNVDKWDFELLYFNVLIHSQYLSLKFIKFSIATFYFVLLALTLHLLLLSLLKSILHNLKIHLAFEDCIILEKTFTLLT